jgi:methyl-accepting chemotaxis protein
MKLFKLFNVRSFKLKSSLIIISVVLPLLIASLALDLNRQAGLMRKAVSDRGLILAVTGAETAGKILSDAVNNGALTEAQMFDKSYRIIPNTSPEKYFTAYDSFIDENLQSIGDAFLKDGTVKYAFVQDTNGYIPSYNSKFASQRIIDDPVSMIRQSQDFYLMSKRILDDNVSLAAARNGEPYLFQEYNRVDTGEVIWDIASPVYVNGRHWGAFRVGIPINATNKNIAVIRNQSIGAGIAIIAVLTMLAFYISRLVTGPLKQLEKAFALVGEGDFTVKDIETSSEDEIGSLARSFVTMVEKLRNVTERTRQSADHIAAYTRELRDTNKSAVITVSTAAVKTTKISEFMKKINNFAEIIRDTSEKSTAGLSDAKSISEDFLTQTENNIVVMSRAGESLNEIGSTVEKIGDIITFVELIADQAYLLSKKAVDQSTGDIKIEDFRAFSAEIQQRAQSVSSAARGLSGLFKSAQVHARQASNAIEKDQETVLDSFNAARETVQSFSLIIMDLKNLTAAVKEGIEYIKMVSDDLLNVYSITEEQNVLIKRYTAATEALNSVFDELQGIIAALKI